MSCFQFNYSFISINAASLPNSRICSAVELANRCMTPGNDSCPSGLMTCPYSGPVISMEIFIEQDVILPVRIILEFPCSSINRSFILFVFKKYAGKPFADILRNLIQIHKVSGSCRTFNFKIIAIICDILVQSPDNQCIYRHPDGSAPVGITAEHTGVRFAGKICHFVVLSIDIDMERMISMIARKGRIP